MIDMNMSYALLLWWQRVLELFGKHKLLDTRGLTTDIPFNAMWPYHMAFTITKNVKITINFFSGGWWLTCYRKMHISLSAQSVLPAVVVAPTINHTTHGWYCTPLLSHTQYSLRIGLKLICMFFSNIHYLLTIRRYMYLKIPETVHPNGPNTTHSPTHCIDVSDLADFIHLSDKFRKNCKY